MAPDDPPQKPPSRPAEPRRAAYYSDDEEEGEDDLTEQEERILLITRLKVLKRGWPDLEVPRNIPEISTRVLRKVYQRAKRRVDAENHAGGFRKWLIGGLVFVEVIAVRLLGLTDMKGFTVNQLMAMNTYQNHLLELAEKYGGDGSSFFPVELRLIFVILVNAVIFFVLKMVLGEAGGDLSRTIAGALGGNGEDSMMSGLLGGIVDKMAGPGAGSAAEEPAAPPPRRRRRKVETET